MNYIKRLVRREYQCSTTDFSR